MFMNVKSKKYFTIAQGVPKKVCLRELKIGDLKQSVFIFRDMMKY